MARRTTLDYDPLWATPRRTEDGPLATFSLWRLGKLIPPPNPGFAAAKVQHGAAGGSRNHGPLLLAQQLRAIVEHIASEDVTLDMVLEVATATTALARHEREYGLGDREYYAGYCHFTTAAWAAICWSLRELLRWQPGAIRSALATAYTLAVNRMIDLAAILRSCRGPDGQIAMVGSRLSVGWYEQPPSWGAIPAIILRTLIGPSPGDAGWLEHLARGGAEWEHAFRRGEVPDHPHCRASLHRPAWGRPSTCLWVLAHAVESGAIPRGLVARESLHRRPRLMTELYTWLGPGGLVAGMPTITGGPDQVFQHASGLTARAYRQAPGFGRHEIEPPPARPPWTGPDVPIPELVPVGVDTAPPPAGPPSWKVVRNLARPGGALARGVEALLRAAAAENLPAARAALEALQGEDRAEVLDRIEAALDGRLGR